MRISNGTCQMKHKRLNRLGQNCLQQTYFTCSALVTAYKSEARRKPEVRGLKTTEISVKISTICRRRASWRAPENDEENIGERGHDAHALLRRIQKYKSTKNSQDIPTRKRSTARPTRTRGRLHEARFARALVSSRAKNGEDSRGTWQRVSADRARTADNGVAKRKKIWVMRRRIIARRLALPRNAIYLPTQRRVFAKVIKMHAARRGHIIVTADCAWVASFRNALSSCAR